MSLRQHPRLIPIKRVLPFARLGRCLSRKDQVYVQTEEAAAKVRYGKGPGEQRQSEQKQTGTKTKRDVPGGPPAFGAECRRSSRHIPDRKSTRLNSSHAHI